MFHPVPVRPAHEIGDGTAWFMAWNRADATDAFVDDLGALRRVEAQADGSLLVMDLAVS